MIQAIVIAVFGEAMLAWDEFHYGDLMRQIGEGHTRLPRIWQQHNEHRIVWTKLFCSVAAFVLIGFTFAGVIALRKSREMRRSLR